VAGLAPAQLTGSRPVNSRPGSRRRGNAAGEPLIGAGRGGVVIGQTGR
jgi:hypothetical protein